MFPSLLLFVFATTLVTAAPSSGNGTTPASFVSWGWYHGFADSSLPPSNINWKKYNHVSYAFLVTTQDPSVLGLTDYDVATLPVFVQQAKAHGTMASVTIGGWAGSCCFSGAVAPQNRSKFVRAILDLVAKYHLDGVDFDWEEPNLSGNGNQYSPQDTANFLAFLRELRAQPAGRHLYISAAVPVWTFSGPDGKPSKDLSGFAGVFDHIAIMNYDINGQNSFERGVGPNAPLDDSCCNVQTGSATKAIKAWIDAGFSANKILLGVPSFGHHYSVKPQDAIDSSGNLTPFPPFSKYSPTTTDTITFARMISQGYLNNDGTHNSKFKYRYDQCSQTPFLYDRSKQMMISYDDPHSSAAKGRFIAQNNLLGFAMWELCGDHGDVLVSSLTSAAGVVHH